MFQGFYCLRTVYAPVPKAFLIAFKIAEGNFVSGIYTESATIRAVPILCCCGISTKHMLW